jgi:ATP-dependent RNA helicase RhlE
MEFSEFELDQRCLGILASQGIEKPTPVQEAAIPIVSAGHDLIATAQTGTGKTLGFALPGLSRLSAMEKLENNMMLVLVPTRELAVQVHSVIKNFGKEMHIRSTAVFGGVGMMPQVDALRRGCQVIIATPGRLLDHLHQKNLDFKNLKILVMDEADRMLDMGFLPDIKRILAQLPKQRQTLMFSATFADDVTALSKEMLNNPKRVAIGMTTRPVDTVRQAIYPVTKEDKSDLLLKVLREENPGSALVFTRTKHRTDRIGKMLKKNNFNAAVIHGDRTQSQRQRALDGFKRGDYQILVATDVASRGIDVENIDYVINFDIPEDADTYIHRIGRTGRAEATGDAITFVSPEDRTLLRDIEKTIGKPLPRKTWEKAPDLTKKNPPREEHRSFEPRREPAKTGESHFGGGRKKKTRKHPNPFQFSGRRDGDRHENRNENRQEGRQESRQENRHENQNNREHAQHGGFNHSRRPGRGHKKMTTRG